MQPSLIDTLRAERAADWKRERALERWAVVVAVVFYIGAVALTVARYAL